MFGKEPAVILGLVGAAIALGVGFGLPVTPAQVGLIMAFISAVLAVITRWQVVSIGVANEQIKTAIKAPSDTTVAEVVAITKEKQG